MEQSKVVKLPEPNRQSETSVEHALIERRSIRSYQENPITQNDIGQIFWAAQGITDPMGFRTAPSAGVLYPLELYLVTGNVDNLPTGVYHYKPNRHELMRIAEGDKREELSCSALYQEWIQDAAAVIIISAVFQRTTTKYGQRGIRSELLTSRISLRDHFVD